MPPEVSRHFTVKSVGAAPLRLNQVTPSCTRSKRSEYVPGFVGAETCAVRLTLWPDARSPGSFVRAPSHTTARPALSYQWYPRVTGYDEFVGNVPWPLFVTITGTLAT